MALVVRAGVKELLQLVDRDLAISVLVDQVEGRR